MKKFRFLTVALLLIGSISVSYGEEAKRHCLEKKNCDCRCNTINCNRRCNDTYVLDKNDVVFSKFQENGLVNIIRTNKETRVVLTVRSKYRYGWVFFSENTFLRDCETGDLYKVRRMANNIPLAKTIYLGDAYGTVEFTMVFPPLRKNVKRIDYIQKNSNHDTRPTKGGNWIFTDIDLTQYPREEPKIIL